MASPQSAFPLQIVEAEDRITVRFPANTILSEANADGLAHALLALAESKAHPHLLIDLGGVALLTSVILAKFLIVNEKVRAAGGRLALFNPTPSVQQVFKVTRLDTVLELHTAAHPLPV